MYQMHLGRFIFMTLFRSMTFVASAIVVYIIKEHLEKKYYEEKYKTMVSAKAGKRTDWSGRNYR